MVKKNDKTAFQLGTDSLSKIVHPRKHSQTVDASIEANREFLDEFKSIVERAKTLSDGEQQTRLSLLLDEIRLSDPISVEEASGDEEALITLATDLLAAVENDDEIPLKSIEKARKLLAARNTTCKMAK